MNKNNMYKVQKIREEVARIQLYTQSEVLKQVLDYIDEVQKEPINKDFEIALEKKVREAQDWTYIEEYGCECPLSEEFGAYDLEEFARWGANWRKDQMMANAVDAVVKIDAGGYPYVDRTIELYDYEADIPLAKRGDKVKVIVIKEE